MGLKAKQPFLDTDTRQAFKVKDPQAKLQLSNELTNKDTEIYEIVLAPEIPLTKLTVITTDKTSDEIQI